MDEQQKKLAEELLFQGEQRPSFAKQLYFGIFDAHKVFPFPQVDEKEKSQVETFIEKFNHYADANLNPIAIDREAHIPESLIKGLGDVGLLGMSIPKEYGGLGMSQYAYCKAMEELSRRCGATALFVNAHQSIGLKALVLFGTEEQKKKHLPPLAAGDQVAAFSLTEPNAGSDASAVETKAEFDKEKNVWRINGQKQWTTNGSIAKVLTLMARTVVDTPKGPQDRITAFLVSPDFPGFKVKDASLEKVGMKGSKTANLIFENLEVPAENVLGEMGTGLKICLTVLDYGRTTFGATCTGAAKVMMEKAIQHANTRIQFHRPLSAFPLIKTKIAHIAALVYAMDATTYLTAGLLDSEQHDIMLEAAILKVFNSEALWYIIYETMQIYGGRSFFTDQPLERMMRDARLNMIGEGANEVLRAFIGVVGMRDVGVNLKSMMDSLSKPFDNYSLLKQFGSSFWRQLQVPNIPVESPQLKSEASQLGKSIRRFSIAIIKLLGKYREEIVDQQLPLNRIANCAIAIYTTTAVLSKIDSEIKSSKGNEVDNHLATAKFYCQMAFKQIDENLNSLFDNNDREIEELSDKITQSHSSKINTQSLKKEAVH